MGFSYKPFFKLLVDRNMKKTDLNSEVGLSSATVAKLSKGEPISGESVEKLCVYFRCQPGDLVAYEFTNIQEAAESSGSTPQSQRKGIHKQKTTSHKMQQTRSKH